MAIERQDLEVTEEERDSSIEKEDQSRQERESALEARLKTEELARARAESALEESRRSVSSRSNDQQQIQPTVSDDQWRQMEEQTGLTRQQIQANAQIMNALTDAKVKPLTERAERAEQEFAKAKAEIESVKSRRSLDSVEASFYDKNPLLKNHRKDVDEFLSEFPDNDKVDAKTLEKRLVLAQDVVRGRIKSMRDTGRGEYRSNRIEGASSDDISEEHEERFNPVGTGNEHAAYLVSKVQASFGRGLRHEDSVDVWKRSLDAEGRGVEISSEEEVAHANRLIRGGSNLGGKRGEK